MTPPEGPTAHPEDVGARMHALITELYPTCRSITGEGVRRTLARIAEEVPLAVHEVPTGTPVFDWEVPREWNIRDAFVADSRDRRVIDFRRHNLHVVSYSVPVDARLSLAELKPHLHSLPDRPDWIPYRTSYYEESWGFCLPHTALEALAEDDYHVVVDSSLEPGSLTYGELLVPGASADEVLVSCHCCHPSLANDNLSGIAVAVELARHLAAQPNRLSYRFLFIPGTIGSITWLALNQDAARRVRHGLVLTCLGDAGDLTYKRSRRGDAAIDRAVRHVLEHADSPHGMRDFEPYGYDERQYCSPGFDLPVGVLSRSRHGEFPEYHTSADDLSFVRPDALADSFRTCLEVFGVLEADRRYLNRSPFGEPQLGRRGLYGGLRGGDRLPGYELALLWVLNLSDGDSTLLDIAERSGHPFAVVHAAAQALADAGLLSTLEEAQRPT